MKKKLLAFVFEAPDYWNDNDIWIEEDDTKKTVREMLSDTLVFCEKRYNKRIDGEGNLNNCIYDVFKESDWLHELIDNYNDLKVTNKDIDLSDINEEVRVKLLALSEKREA